jgi:hypothetical protein
MNAIELKQKCTKFNEAGRYSAAHNGLVAAPSRFRIFNARKQPLGWRLTIISPLPELP